MMASLRFNMGGTWTCHVDCLWPLALTSDQPMIPLFCMQWSLRAYPKESEGAGGRFYIWQTTLGALAVTWPLKNLRVDQVTVCQCVCVDTSRKTYPHMKLYHRQNRVDPLQSWRCTIPLLTDEQNEWNLLGGAVGDHQAAPGERRSTFGRDRSTLLQLCGSPESCFAMAREAVDDKSNYWL